MITKSSKCYTSSHNHPYPTSYTYHTDIQFLPNTVTLRMHYVITQIRVAEAIKIGRLS